MDLKEQEVLAGDPGAHWYYRAKSAAMLRMLRGRAMDSVLDVGAGSGFFSRVLLERTACREAVCVDPNYAVEYEETVNGKPIRFVRSADAFSGSLVLMMDVLEHVADDAALLRDTAARCRPGTHILITVPAIPWLWSGHDVFLAHYRRYTLGSVRRVIAAAGLRPVSVCYFFGLVLPAAAAVRLRQRWRHEAPKSDMRRHGALVNWVLSRICAAELAVSWGNRVAGLSVFAVCER